jgi:ABC-type uncharacterized transport system fused permease/ATPase subunit
LELRQFATLGESGSLADNPDQRIQEDIQLFTSDTVGTELGFA